MEQAREPSWSLAQAPVGPLAARIDAFTSLLVDQGYAAFSAHLETRLVADFSRWLMRRRVTLQDITAADAERYLHAAQRQTRAIPARGQAPGFPQGISQRRRALRPRRPCRRASDPAS